MADRPHRRPWLRGAARAGAAAALLAGTWAVARGTAQTALARTTGRPNLLPGTTGRGRATFQPSARSLAARYEVKDLSAPGTAGTLAALAVMAIVLTGIVFGLIALFAHLDRADLPPLTAQQVARIVPPAPHLQAHPFADLAQLQQHQERLLDSYAWVDSAHRRARIPVGRAMQIAVGRSLDAPP